jgi:hypothetical protein
MGRKNKMYSLDEQPANRFESENGKLDEFQISFFEEPPKEFKRPQSP